MMSLCIDSGAFKGSRLNGQITTFRIGFNISDLKTIYTLLSRNPEILLDILKIKIPNTKSGDGVENQKSVGHM